MPLLLGASMPSPVMRGGGERDALGGESAAQRVLRAYIARANSPPLMNMKEL